MEKTKCLQKINKDIIVEFEKKIFIYSNKKFNFIILDDKIYFKSDDIVNFLELNNTKESLIKNISENEKINLENNKDDIYVTEYGLYEIVISSIKEEAKLFKNFIIKEFLPYFEKNNFHSKKVKLDTSFITSFYEKHSLQQ